MSIAFVKTLAAFSGAAPATSGAFTPTNSADFLIYFDLTGDGINEVLAMSGTAGTWPSQGTQFNTSTSATFAVHANLNSSAVSQTVTLTDATVGFVAAYGGGVEYSGASSITNVAFTENANPGLGAGAIVGASVVVPTGSVLVVEVLDIFNSETITSTVGGTTRGSSVFNPSYLLLDFAGTGAAIQPKFTTSANGTADYIVTQFMLNPPGVAPIPPRGPMPRQLYVMP